MTIKLSDIEKRLEAATPGPWYAVADNTGVSTDPDGTAFPSQPELIFCLDDGEYIENRNKADAEFVANAPADIAYLLRLVGELEAALEIIADRDTNLPHVTAADALAARKKAGLE